MSSHNAGGFCTLAPGGTRFQLHRPTIGMVGVDVTPGNEKSLVGVGIELEALKSEDCHHSQGYGPGSTPIMSR